MSGISQQKLAIFGLARDILTYTILIPRVYFPDPADVPLEDNGCLLLTFGCLQWESEISRGVMRARCYLFKMCKHSYRGMNPQVNYPYICNFMGYPLIEAFFSQKD